MSRRGGGSGGDGRLADQLEDITIAISELTDKIDILMIQVQSGGSGGGVSPVGIPTGSVAADLSPIEKRLDALEENMITRDDFNRLNQQLELLTSGKVEKADSIIANATRLIERGLSLTELETVLLEIKEKLEELIIELSAVVLGKQD
ncbi:MAG: hypothetical protein ACFFC7_14290 [Candidatus Hermodarchaeota archaeon]